MPISVWQKKKPIKRLFMFFNLIACKTESILIILAGKEVSVVEEACGRNSKAGRAVRDGLEIHFSSSDMHMVTACFSNKSDQHFCGM